MYSSASTLHRLLQWKFTQTSRCIFCWLCAIGYYLIAAFVYFFCVAYFKSTPIKVRFVYQNLTHLPRNDRETSIRNAVNVIQDIQRHGGRSKCRRDTFLAVEVTARENKRMDYSMHCKWVVDEKTAATQLGFLCRMHIVNFYVKCTSTLTRTIHNSPYRQTVWKVKDYEYRQPFLVAKFNFFVHWLHFSIREFTAFIRQIKQKHIFAQQSNSKYPITEWKSTQPHPIHWQSISIGNSIFRLKIRKRKSVWYLTENVNYNFIDNVFTALYIHFFLFIEHFV